MSRKSFILYIDSRPAWEALTLQQRGELITAIFVYADTGELIKLSAALIPVFSLLKAHLDRDATKWNEIAKKRRAAGRKGAEVTNSGKWRQESANGDKSQQSAAVSVNENVNDKKKFLKPTINEIKKYCRERKNNIDPALFYDHYEANGWKRGKTPISDWKACIRTWERADGSNESRNKERNYGI